MLQHYGVAILTGDSDKSEMTTESVEETSCGRVSRNREVTGSTLTRSTASNLEQLLCAQANSACYPQRGQEMSSSSPIVGYVVKA